ncbi:MAG: serine hydrolase domain-containing protein [Bacteroidia bacterium]
MLKYSITIVIFGLLLACGASQTGGEKKPEPVAGDNDSIQQIRKEIHADEKAALLKEIFRVKVKDNKLNACVLVAQRGQIIYENSYGYSDLAKKTPLTIRSAFQLASVSKTLTAGAVLLLKDQGKLQLTDDVKKYIPDFPYDGVTIKSLLCHRSGLSNYIYFGEPYCDDKNCYNGKTFDNNAVLEIMKTVKPAPYAAPDKKFEYCNTNYALLATIVEKISGQDFPDFMEQNIFRPLGMNDSWVHRPGKDKDHDNVTKGHDGFGKAEVDFYSDDVLGDKGVYATVEDLLKWDQALYSEKLLKKETLEEAFTGYSNEHKGKRNYGLGWRLTDDGVHPKIIYHNGWWHGYTTLFYRRPADQTTVIILSNKFSRATYHIEDVLSVLGDPGASPDPEE